MVNIQFFVRFVAWLVFVKFSFGNILNDDRGVVFNSHPGKLLSIPAEMTNVTQMSSKVDDNMDCVFACIGQTWCRSVNFKTVLEKDGKYICELLSADNFTQQSNIQQNSSFTLLSIKNPCEANPCLNGGKCVADGIDLRCECKGHVGENCEILDIVPKSCSELKTMFPTKPSGNYVIDPDGQSEQKPFTVHCDMTDKGGVGVTVVSHDSEARTLVDNCMNCIRNVVYSVTMAQLAKLTQISAHCEQFIKFECKDDVSFVADGDAWWVSRDGVRQEYWGGATPGSGKCACGMTNTCENSKGCNCNNVGSSGKGSFSDSGLLTDKSTLPVTQMRFSDTDQSHEQGYHTLGKLKCYGQT